MRAAPADARPCVLTRRRRARELTVNPRRPPNGFAVVHFAAVEHRGISRPPPAQHDVCPLGTHWHQLQCVHQCARTRWTGGHRAARESHHCLADWRSRGSRASLWRLCLSKTIERRGYAADITSLDCEEWRHTRPLASIDRASVALRPRSPRHRSGRMPTKTGDGTRARAAVSASAPVDSSIRNSTSVSDS